MPINLFQMMVKKEKILIDWNMTKGYLISSPPLKVNRIKFFLHKILSRFLLGCSNSLKMLSTSSSKGSSSKGSSSNKRCSSNNRCSSNWSGSNSTRDYWGSKASCNSSNISTCNGSSSPNDCSSTNNSSTSVTSDGCSSNWCSGCSNRHSTMVSYNSVGSITGVRTNNSRGM